MQFFGGYIVDSDFSVFTGKEKADPEQPLDPFYNDGSYFTDEEVNLYNQ